MVEGEKKELVHAYMLVIGYAFLEDSLYGKQVEVSLVRGSCLTEFKFIHPIHGELHCFKDRGLKLRHLIDQGLLVLPETATLLSRKYINKGDSCPSTDVHYWVKIGIKSHSVEHVSQIIFSDCCLRVFLDIHPLGDIPCPDSNGIVFEQMFNQWKTTGQFLFDEVTAVLGFGLHPPEDVIMSSSLSEHQKQGLRWMYYREKYDPVADEDQLFPFWEEKNGVYRDHLCDFITLKRPSRICGGILADETGMGKTLTLLSLISFTRKTTATATSHLRKRRKLLPHQEHNPTLVVCPPPVMAIWKRQIKQWTSPGALKCCTYSSSKQDDTNWLMQHDIVLATYNDVNIPDSVLYQVEWWRVILDDAHVFLAPYPSASVRHRPPFVDLKAKRRWAVTGKPIHEDFENYPLDSIMLFLGLPVFGSEGSQPLQSKALSDIFSLRRTMPVKSIENHLVVLSKYERDIYEWVETIAKNTASLGSKLSIQSLQEDVLLAWLCCNGLEISRASMLCKYMNIQELSSGEPELLRKVVNALQDDKYYSCPVCLDQHVVLIVTRCSHMFCGVCIERLFNKWKGKSCCPMCRAILTKEDIFATERGFHTPATARAANLSSKVSSLLSLLVKSRKDDPSRKSIIITQFHKLLMPITKALLEAGFNVKHMDVTDKAEKKAKIVKEFRKANPPVIWLATFEALSDDIPGGLDLSADSVVVYLMEPCWNVKKERELLNRMHGYWTNAANAKYVRLVCKDTIEERVLEIREEQTHVKDICLSDSVSSLDPTKEVHVRKYSENLRLLGLALKKI